MFLLCSEVCVESVFLQAIIDCPCECFVNIDRMHFLLTQNFFRSIANAYSSFKEVNNLGTLSPTGLHG